MKIYLQDGTARTFEGDGATVSEILLSIGVNPAGVIVSRNGRVVPEDAIPDHSDEIRIIRVSHGG